MISVIGGKLTTAGWIARQCAAKLGIKSVPSGPAVVVSSHEIEQSLGQKAQQLAAVANISEEGGAGLIEWFGERAADIANSAQNSSELRTTVCPHTSHIVAEAAYALQHEHAVTLSDVLLRRVPVALGKCWSQECAEMAAQRIGAAVGWDARQINNQLEQFEAEYENFLRKSSQVTR
jgi:glycerol-3-phosphate dehydrogenase